MSTAQEWDRRRRAMVEQTLARPRDLRRAVTDTRVLAAMSKVPRERFVPEAARAEAYADRPLDIGHGQTISQPYIVAVMTALLDVQADHRVLEVGTGSGYQAAVLAELAAEVLTIEVVAPLARRAATVLAELGYANVRCRAGDGREGWPEEAPFPRILVTAAARELPEALLDQLAVGGRLVAPVGDPGEVQALTLVRRLSPGPGGLRAEGRMKVRFVPLVGG